MESQLVIINHQRYHLIRQSTYKRMGVDHRVDRGTSPPTWGDVMCFAPPPLFGVGRRPCTNDTAKVTDKLQRV